MLESGELPSMRVGKAIRVPVAALRQWVEANTSEAKL
jgi:excisionase family DNA binding protein